MITTTKMTALKIFGTKHEMTKAFAIYYFGIIIQNQKLTVAKTANFIPLC